MNNYQVQLFFMRNTVKLQVKHHTLTVTLKIENIREIETHKNWAN